MSRRGRETISSLLEAASESWAGIQCHRAHDAQKQPQLLQCLTCPLGPETRDSPGEDFPYHPPRPGDGRHIFVAPLCNFQTLLPSSLLKSPSWTQSVSLDIPLPIFGTSTNYPPPLPAARSLPSFPGEFSFYLTVTPELFQSSFLLISTKDTPASPFLDTLPCSRHGHALDLLTTHNQFLLSLSVTQLIFLSVSSQPVVLNNSTSWTSGTCHHPLPISRLLSLLTRPIIKTTLSYTVLTVLFSDSLGKTCGLVRSSRAPLPPLMPRG